MHFFSFCPPTVGKLLLPPIVVTTPKQSARGAITHHILAACEKVKRYSDTRKQKKNKQCPDTQWSSLRERKESQVNVWACKCVCTTWCEAVCVHTYAHICFVSMLTICSTNNNPRDSERDQRGKFVQVLVLKEWKVTPERRMDDLWYPSLDQRRKRHLIGLWII